MALRAMFVWRLYIRITRGTFLEIFMPGSQFKYTDKRISGARDLHKLMKKGSVPGHCDT